jgi:hypothetical protein
MAEVVKDLPPTADAPQPWLQPIREGIWVDPNGTHWKLRRSCSLQRIERLLDTADVEVLRCYGPDAPSRIPLAERRHLWERALPYLEGRPRPSGDHADFAVGEFQDGQRTLVIFEESC